MSLQVGYPPRDDERELLLSGGVEATLAALRPILTQEELLALQRQVCEVQVAEKLADYMLALAEATRQPGDYLLGVSPRGVQGLYRATQALALCEGREFCIPDDVQRLAAPVLAHRVVLRRGVGSLDEARRAIEKTVAATPVPL